ncbi:MAG TPA: T9SS type A sorting domain-containing protein, partial [Bacteroidia bacterium]|nr:T9SS type A sorting domain-containing protein [Bacteroidia bacterium]
APSCINTHSESTWLGLPDGSILFVDNILFGAGLSSERYIPSSNQWIADANLPDSLYDLAGYETGGACMLPDGRAFFIGATGHTAYYTPSGSISPGSWQAGPDLPNHLGPSDGAAAMMVNGKILIAAAPANTSTGTYKSPTWFYEFDYNTNTYLKVNAPIGGDTLSEPCYLTNMLDLPDGNVLFANLGEKQYYVYTPNGMPVASGKPTINNITQQAGCIYRITGTLFNGISEGAVYGDDWQMATNYPIIRLTSGAYVYYMRSFNWNRTGVQTGNLSDTTYFTVPSGLQADTYSLVVTANGISSAPFTFVYTPCTTAINLQSGKNSVRVYPNPAIEKTVLEFNSPGGEEFKIKMVDLFGRIVKEESGTALAGNNSHTINLADIAKGVYEVVLEKGNTFVKTKIVVK